MKSGLFITMMLALVAACGPKDQTPDEALSIYLTPDIMCGTVTFTDGCGPEMDRLISFGLALIHHMTYEDAEYTFDQVIAQDPDCFWGHWGKAMTYIHPLWSDIPSEEQMQLGWTLSQRALTLATKDNERLYGEALAAYYQDPLGDKQLPDRLAAFHAGWKAAHEGLPDDIEAELFYGLTKLSIVSPADKSYAVRHELGAIAERVLEQIPDHPGGYHYAIHAYDVPALAGNALRMARNYGNIAPEIPHALHMPSHIFIRLGYWIESIDWNTRSAEAALRLPVQGKVSMHYLHALDYMVYAELQQGAEERAEQHWREILSLEEEFLPHPAGAYALATIPARIALEQHNWVRAADLDVPQDMFDWEAFPAFEVVTHFARAIGAAHIGDQKTVEDALDRIDALYEQVSVQRAYAYWANQMDIQRTAVRAWQAYAKDDIKNALTLMRKAAEMEAATEKHPISPGEVLPMQEMLGDMLMTLDRPAEALVEYQKALVRTPNRFNSTYGAGRAAELTGDLGMAMEYYRSLLDFASTSKSRADQLEHARDFVAKAI